MRMLDAERDTEVVLLQLYLRAEEARGLRDHLSQLLEEPEALTHAHVLDRDGRDLSVSIVTPNKLHNVSGYTAVERRILGSA